MRVFKSVDGFRWLACIAEIGSAVMIVVTFALPQESSDFRRQLQGVRPVVCSGKDWLLGRCGAKEVLLGHTGIGSEAARDGLPLVLREYRPEFVISGGFAGGLDGTLELGSLFVATNFSDSALIERARHLLEAELCWFGPMHTS